MSKGGFSKGIETGNVKIPEFDTPYLRAVGICLHRPPAVPKGTGLC